MTTEFKERHELLKLVESLEGESLQKVKIFIAGMEAQQKAFKQYGLLPESSQAQAGQAAGARA